MTNLTNIKDVISSKFDVEVIYNRDEKGNKTSIEMLQVFVKNGRYPLYIKEMQGVECSFCYIEADGIMYKEVDEKNVVKKLNAEFAA